jgi:hypothetical protein
MEDVGIQYRTPQLVQGGGFFTTNFFSGEGEEVATTVTGLVYSTLRSGVQYISLNTIGERSIYFTVILRYGYSCNNVKEMV